MLNLKSSRIATKIGEYSGAKKGSIFQSFGRLLGYQLRESMICLQKFKFPRPPGFWNSGARVDLVFTGFAKAKDFY